MISIRRAWSESTWSIRNRGFSGSRRSSRGSYFPYFTFAAMSMAAVHSLAAPPIVNRPRGYKHSSASLKLELLDNILTHICEPHPNVSPLTDGTGVQFQQAY